MLQKYILLSAVAPPFPRPTSNSYLLVALLINKHALGHYSLTLPYHAGRKNTSHSSQSHRSAARRELTFGPDQLWETIIKCSLDSW